MNCREKVNELNEGKRIYLLGTDYVTQQAVKVINRQKHQREDSSRKKTKKGAHFEKNAGVGTSARVEAATERTT
jgi:mevalonate pyrophosphate decarboxylase